MSDFSYRDYVTDEKFLAEYNAYQQRYAGTLRESDKVLVALTRRIREESDRDLDVLDIGCSTGNLLLHLRNMVPGVNLVGGDLARSSIDECRANPKLAGIAFEEMDLLGLPQARFDIAIVNAVFYMLDDDQYARALASVAKCLRPGGKCLVYDFAHPFVHQKLTIMETSVLHPQGLRLVFRPMPSVTRDAKAAGFASVDFHPFELPIDLAMPGYDQEVTTYTVDRKDGSRAMFRGALFQPWCHMIMSKA